MEPFNEAAYQLSRSSTINGYLRELDNCAETLIQMPRTRELVEWITGCRG
jgi:hypothetical protein